MLVALIAGLTLANFDPSKPVAAQPPPAKAAAKTICWTEEPVGSHLPHRYCAPVAYWELRQRMDREALHAYGMGIGGGGGHGGGSMGAAASAARGEGN